MPIAPESFLMQKKAVRYKTTPVPRLMKFRFQSRKGRHRSSALARIRPFLNFGLSALNLTLPACGGGARGQKCRLPLKERITFAGEALESLDQLKAPTPLALAYLPVEAASSFMFMHFVRGD